MTPSFRVLALLLAATTISCGSDRITTRRDDLGTTLRITLAADAQGRDLRSWTLTCDPSGGTHPSPDSACAALDRAPDAFAPPPTDRACTEIYGGPAVGTVTGTYRGRTVDARFSRTDGCEIARWDAVAALFPGPLPSAPVPTA